MTSYLEAPNNPKLIELAHKRDMYLGGQFPDRYFYPVSGQGAYFETVDGKKYLDFTSGHGSQIFGYGHEPVNKNIAIALGQSAGLPGNNQEEQNIAESLRMLIQGDKFFFYDSLGDILIDLKKEAPGPVYSNHLPVNAEVVLGQAYQDRQRLRLPGKDGVVYISFTPEHIPDKDFIADLGFIKKTGDNIIVTYEPASFFRMNNYCYTNFYDIKPDFTIIGNPIGSGLPFYCLVVGRDVNSFQPAHERPAVDRLTLASARATLATFMKGYNVNDFVADARFIVQSLNEVAPSKVLFSGNGAFGKLKGSYENIKKFKELCRKAGVYMQSEYYFSTPLVEKKKEVVSILTDILRLM